MPMRMTLPQPRRVWYPLGSVMGAPPSPRCSHTCTVVGDALYIIGGGKVQGVVAGEPEFHHYGDVHRLDLRLLRWSRVLPNPCSFTPRRGHSAALHEPSGRIVCFSGTRGLPSDRLLTDVHVLHTSAGAGEDGTGEVPPMRWEQPQVRGTPPSARRGHRAVILADDAMFVIGGYPHLILGSSDLELSMHVLQLSSWTWGVVQVKTRPGPRLRQRPLHSALSALLSLTSPWFERRTLGSGLGSRPSRLTFFG